MIQIPVRVALADGSTCPVCDEPVTAIITDPERPAIYDPCGHCWTKQVW